MRKKKIGFFQRKLYVYWEGMNGSKFIRKIIEEIMSGYYFGRKFSNRAQSTYALRTVYIKDTVSVRYLSGNKS